MNLDQTLDKKSNDIFPEIIRIYNLVHWRKFSNEIIESIIKDGDKFDGAPFFDLLIKVGETLKMPLSKEEAAKITESVRKNYLALRNKVKKDKIIRVVTSFEKVKTHGRSVIDEIRFDNLFERLYKKFGTIEGNYLDWGFGDGKLAYILDAFHNGHIDYKKESPLNPKDGILINNKIKYYSSDIKYFDEQGDPQNCYTHGDGLYIKPSIYSEVDAVGERLRFNNDVEVEDGFFNLVISAGAHMSEKQFIQLDKSIKTGGYFIYTGTTMIDNRFKDLLLDTQTPLEKQLDLNDYIFNNENYQIVDGFQMYEKDRDKTIYNEVFMIFQKTNKKAVSNVKRGLEPIKSIT